MRTPTLHAAVAALLAAGPVASHAGRAAAQATPAPHHEPVFTTLDLEGALAESKRTKRLLVVYPRKDGAGFDAMDARTWPHPGLRAWLGWHAVVCRVDAREDYRTYAALTRLSPDIAEVMSEALPVVLLFREGRLERAIPHESMQNWSWMGPVTGADGQFFKPDPKVFYPKPAQLLLALQMHLDGLATTDPIWLAQHELRNPVPPEPPAALLHASDDGLGERVADPRPGSAADVLERLRSAREAVRAGELHRATGLYTWLWERAPAFAPAAGATRAAVIVPEMRSLAGLRDASRARFEAVRSALEARQPWWSYEDRWEWTLLNTAVGDEGRVIELSDVLLADPAELPLLTADDRAALTMIVEAAVLLAGDAGRAAPDAMAWVQRESGRIGGASGSDEPPGSPVGRLRRRIVLDLACRLYADCLERSDAQGAVEMEHAALLTAPEPEARAALLWTALLAGVADADHLAWLDLQAMRGLDPALRDAIREAAAGKAR